jgi:hypothetical protein
MFNAEDVERAHNTWGCNCGPAALAAVMNLTLDQTRPLMGDFEAKRYTNPTLMFESVERCNRPWHKVRGWPAYGLSRIQWSGPWTKPGVPARAAYRFSHWVGVWTRGDGIGIFDINAIANGWCHLEDWKATIVPFILESIPHADGGWWVTHSIEVERT